MKLNNLLLACLLILFFASCTAENKDGIMTTPDGMNYKIVKKGSGEKSVAGNYALYNGVAESLEGVEVFSTKAVNQPGIVKLEASTAERANPYGDVFLNLSVGDSVHVYLGKAQGVSESGHDSLVFKMGYAEQLNEEAFNKKMEELNKQRQEELKRQYEEDAPKREALKAREADVAKEVSTFYTNFKAGKLNSKLSKTDTGLRYMLVEDGEGDNFKVGDQIAVYYYGVLSRNGEMFDNSFQRGQDFKFRVGTGSVIKGWDEGAQLLKKGSKAFLVIPSDLAYGQADRGQIKPGDELIFYIESPK